MDSLSPAEKVAELKEAFTLFDADGDGLIASADIGKVLRQLGFNPTEAECADLVHLVDTEGKGSIDFEGFLALVQSQPELQKDADAEAEELREAFWLFDKAGKGYIDAADLRTILTSLGEKLTDEEVDDMLATACNSGTGKIHFEDFIAMMTSK